MPFASGEAVSRIYEPTLHALREEIRFELLKIQLWKGGANDLPTAKHRSGFRTRLPTNRVALAIS